MTTRPTAELRRQVIERAGNHCEYCWLHQDVAASTHQVDHVIAEKHGGQTSPDNLALSCTVCNRRKGSDISSIDPSRTVSATTRYQLDGYAFRKLKERPYYTAIPGCAPTGGYASPAAIDG